MKKILLVTAIFTSFISVAQSQRGRNQIGFASDIGLPMGHFDNDFNTGYGGSLKGLWGVAKSGQVTFTTGYTRYESKGELSNYHGSSGIIPFLAGYRLIKGGFYTEPQIGYGLYRLTLKDYTGEKLSETNGAFTYAIGVGFTTHGIDLGIRYQGAKKGSDDLTLVGIHVGYILSFKK